MKKGLREKLIQAHIDTANEYFKAVKDGVFPEGFGKTDRCVFCKLCDIKNSLGDECCGKCSMAKGTVICIDMLTFKAISMTKNCFLSDWGTPLLKRAEFHLEAAKILSNHRNYKQRIWDADKRIFKLNK